MQTGAMERWSEPKYISVFNEKQSPTQQTKEAKYSDNMQHLAMMDHIWSFQNLDPIIVW